MGSLVACGDCCENPGDDLVPHFGVMLHQRMRAHEDAVFREVVRSVDGVGAALVAHLAVEQDAGARGVFRVELAGALDEDVVALEDVGRGGDVGRHGVIVAAVAVDDEGQPDRHAPFMQGPGQVEYGSAAERLPEENDVGLGGFVRGELAIAVEVEGFADELLAEFQLVVFDRLDMDAGELFALQHDRIPADAAGGVVPALPAADDAEDQGVAGLDRHGHGEVVEGLIAGVGAQQPRQQQSQQEGL